VIKKWDAMVYYFKIKVFTSYIVHTTNLKVRVNEKE